MANEEANEDTESRPGRGWGGHGERGHAQTMIETKCPTPIRVLVSVSSIAPFPSLPTQMESVSKQAEEAQALRDQVDDLKHVAEKLEKTERQLDALKKKAEDANDLRRQLKVAAHATAPSARVTAPVFCSCRRRIDHGARVRSRSNRSSRRCRTTRPRWPRRTGRPAACRASSTTTSAATPVRAMNQGRALGDSDEWLGGDSGERVRGDSDERVGGDSDERVGGDSVERVGGDLDERVGGDSDERVGGDSDERVGGRCAVVPCPAALRSKLLTLFVLSNPADGSALDKEKEELQKAHTRAEVERMQAQSQLALRNQEYEKQAATLRSLQERLEEAELNASLGGSGTRPDLTRPQRQCRPMRLILSRALTLRQAGPTLATARSSPSCTLGAAAFPSTWRRGLTPCPPPRLSAYFFPTDRRTKNAQLEQENRMLRAAGGADGAASGQAAVLDAILSDTKAAKDKLEAVRGPPGDPSTVLRPSSWGLNVRSRCAHSESLHRTTRRCWSRTWACRSVSRCWRRRWSARA